MWGNPFVIWLLRSPLHGLLSAHFMVITYTGRKSGKIFRVPVNYVQDDHTLYVSSDPKRTWWRNFRHPAQVTLRLRGKDVPAQAEALEQSAAVAEGLEQIVRHMPASGRDLGISLDAQGQPDPQSLQKAAMGRVVVMLTIG